MKIAAVVVTYNRLNLLKKVIEAFDRQTRLPDYLIIVDNASNDGTYQFLDEYEKVDIQGMKKIIIHNPQNLGGSGGFHVGTEKAMKLDVDWIWVSDDDAIPNDDVFFKAEKHIQEIPNTKDISAVCTKVLTDGEIVESNRSRRKKGLFKVMLNHVNKSEYADSSFVCDNFSYVGVFMNKKKLEKVGLIHPEYFIWRDDVEHSWRLSEVGKIICFTDMIVDHRVNVVDYDGITWKTYYAYRNDISMLKEHTSFRYYAFKIVTAFFKGLFSMKYSNFKLYISAIKGALSGETGINDTYKPGTKVV